MTRNSEVAQRVADRFKQGDTVLATLEQFPPGIVFDRIQFLSRKHRLTAYDAAYLELALKNGLALATLDEALLRECKNAGVPVVGL
jgi:predicted nucleic acid-binding protein